MVLSEIDRLFLSQASFQRRSQRKDTILRVFITIFCETIGLIVSQKSSAAEAEGRLPKSFGFGRLCSASVIVWLYRTTVYSTGAGSHEQRRSFGKQGKKEEKKNLLQTKEKCMIAVVCWQGRLHFW